MAYPKILILNQPFVSDTGGGITQSNLFSGWDPDCLAVACSGYLLTDGIASELCNNYYQLGDEERKWMFPFNLISRQYESGEIKFSDHSKNKVIAEESKSKSRTSFISKYVEPFFDYSGLVHFISKTGLSPQFCKWITDFDPDVIYAQGSTRESILLNIAVQKFLNKPMVFHMMDDWPALFGRKGFMKNYWKNKIDKEFRHMLDCSQVLMGISDYMGEAYKKRYHKEFSTFHNPIDIGFWKSGQKIDYTINQSPTILYAGRISLGIDNSVMTIASAIDKVNKEENLSIKFVIQAQAPQPWFKEYNCIKYQKFVAYKDLPKVFGSASFMILPYDFDTEGLAFIKYSMPTKASEYMVSGTPVLIFAPEDTALVQYAKKNKWATVVTENDTNVLANKLKHIINNPEECEKMATSAKELANKRHSMLVVSRNFQDKLAALAGNIAFKSYLDKNKTHES